MARKVWIMALGCLALSACAAPRMAPPAAAPPPPVIAAPAPPAAPAPNAEGDRLARLISARSVDDQCRAMPRRTRAEYDGLVDQLSERFQQRAGADALAAARSRAENRSAQPVECDTNAILGIRDALIEARRLVRTS